MNVLQHVTYNSENSMKNVLVLVRIDSVLLVPNIKYLNLKGAKVNRDGLVTLLRECKGLETWDEMLNDFGDAFNDLGDEE
ncbi:unnamed protein product [Prunus armeniaca]